MTHRVLTDAGLWIDEHDLSGDHNRVALEATKSMHDDTVFGLNNRRMIAGMLHTRFGHAGYWSSVADDAYFSRLGLKNTVMSLAIAKTEGDVAYLTRSVVASYTPEGRADDGTFAFEVGGEVDDVLIRGFLMRLMVAGGTGTGPAVQVGAVAASQRVYVAIHITAITASDVDIFLRHDDNSGMTSPATEAGHSFLNFTVPGVTWDSTVTGPITDDWWDVQVNVTGGTVTLAVMVGIL